MDNVRQQVTERSNRALDEFAHAISHDLKAPLRSVANYARRIEEGLGAQLTGEPRAHMELLRTQVERMKDGAHIAEPNEGDRERDRAVPDPVASSRSIAQRAVSPCITI
jgi:signal transduction histidine kinase